MTSAAIPRTHLDQNQRLSAALVLSLLIHGLLILGVGFTLGDPAPMVPTLDVIFSQAQTTLSPEQADFLAQANNRGGGEHDTPQRPRDSQLGGVESPEPGRTPYPMRARNDAASSAPEARFLTSRRGEYEQAQSHTPRNDVIEPQVDTQGNAPFDTDAARLAAEYNAQSELYARRPVRKFVSASTREYAYANYLRTWVDRVERVGNLNYPDEARQRRLSGEVIIGVAVRRDGTVESSKIMRSSGLPVLDDSALRIVQLSQPFSPLPDTGERVDVLHIMRTWRFLPGGRLEDHN
ncbi:MAG: energy transducer TonB [Xanthomonadaceae bacterium]|jgi:protein TonB|nr:energy transducer TonB [Xanthomonadaceae bacterium]